MKADLATIGPEATLKARRCVGPTRKVALRAAKQNLVNGARPETPGMNERGPPIMTPLWANPAPASLPAQFGLVGGGDSTLA